MNIGGLITPSSTLSRLKVDYIPHQSSINVDTKIQGGRGCFKRVDSVTKLPTLQKRLEYDVDIYGQSLGDQVY